MFIFRLNRNRQRPTLRFVHFLLEHNEIIKPILQSARQLVSDRTFDFPMPRYLQKSTTPQIKLSVKSEEIVFLTSVKVFRTILELFVSFAPIKRMKNFQKKTVFQKPLKCSINTAKNILLPQPSSKSLTSPHPCRLSQNFYNARISNSNFIVAIPLSTCVTFNNAQPCLDLIIVIEPISASAA